MTELLVNVDVDDLERGLRFYAEGLGLRLRRRLGPDVAELEGAGCPVFLTRHAAGTRPFTGATSGREFGRHWTPVHLDFVVPDLDAAVRRAEAAGARPEGEVRAYVWGRYRVMADPFGNGFCVLQFEGRGYAEIASAFFEPDGTRPTDPVAAVIGCIEQGAQALLLDAGALPATFFDLRSGVAGEVVQKLTNYGLRMAAVVPDLGAKPPRFQEFAREANAGRQLRFFATRGDALDWLGAR